MTTTDVTPCGSANGGAKLTPVNPFYALRYQFGMLLGVTDFESEQAYLRGKSRLHNAWLHREGVVWGMDVQLVTTLNSKPIPPEILVTPGLALDGAGHELHLDANACVDLGKWYEANKDKGLTVRPVGDGFGFDAHVVIAFQACLTRPVPALAEPCQNGNSETAFSRVFETVKLSLLPNRADISPKPYHRLRLLFNLEDPILVSGGTAPTPGDQAVLDARDQILARPLTDQPKAYLDWFRVFAALDEIDLRPATGPDGTSLLLFPAADETPVLLANIEGIRLTPNGSGGYVLASAPGGTVHREVRPSHVATATIEELLCGPLFRVPPPAAPAAVGPQVVPGSVTIVNPNSITLNTDLDVNPATVQNAAFSVSFFNGGAAGWTDLVVDKPTWTAGTKLITLPLKNAIGKTGLLRIIARGTGPSPLLGSAPNAIPLGGTSNTTDGQDFVYMKEVS